MNEDNTTSTCLTENQCSKEEPKKEKLKTNKESIKFNLKQEKEIINNMADLIYKLNKKEKYINYIKCVNSL